MRSRKTRFRSLRLSLKDILGGGYVNAVCRARSFVTGRGLRTFEQTAAEKVDFLPDAFQRRLLRLLPKVGRTVARPFSRSARGAPTAAFEAASNAAAAPLTGFGYYRIGEAGRLHFISKSEHYHAPLGHGFPGYRLLTNARDLGIPNATHNNTRGHITRVLEGELIRAANGLPRGDSQALASVLLSRGRTVLNRVINLQTGSLAVEAALKMMLARFYLPDSSSPKPVYAGRVPVFVVIGADDGALGANYHGTTTLTQLLRGMWPEMLSAFEKSRVMMVRAVSPEDTGGLDALFARWDSGRHKIAGFFHEFVMMNYGARRLSKAFVRRAYALCRRHDVPTIADEIQSCLWCPGLFSFREYGVKPTFVAVGKGFPAGEYAASRIIFNSSMDRLQQFGALVTNGQEELASLAYLITMLWAKRNEEVIRAVGDYYHEGLRSLAQEHRGEIEGIDGDRHMGAIRFKKLSAAKAFVDALNAAGLDISVQAYKADCPPSALTKLPLIAGYEAVDMVVARMHEALSSIDRRKG